MRYIELRSTFPEKSKLVCSPFLLQKFRVQEKDFSELLKMYVAIDDFAYRKGHIQWVSHTKDDGQKDEWQTGKLPHTQGNEDSKEKYAKYSKFT